MISIMLAQEVTLQWTPKTLQWNPLYSEPFIPQHNELNFLWGFPNQVILRLNKVRQEWNAYTPPSIHT